MTAISDETRIVVLDWRTVVDGKPNGGIYSTKQAVAKKIGISVRTLHRWLDKDDSLMIGNYFIVVLPVIKKNS